MGKIITSENCDPSSVPTISVFQAIQEKMKALEGKLSSFIHAYKNRFLDENIFDLINETNEFTII